MTITFHDQCGVPANHRGELQLWVEKNVDRDNDFYTNAHGTTDGHYVVIRHNWHKSPEDPNEHLTALVYVNKKHNSTAHVSRTGQVTLFSQGTNEFKEFTD
ncbi:hypothetical protein JB92DRAFT_3104107 [Gautieria morchelliformis]|nr:hypothetical protein JB92DRAFT_3104107 [Gautieria morchelliformis]